MAKPRIITETVKRLRRLALEAPAFSVVRANRTEIERWAAELDAFDARETRLDPSRRRKPSRRPRRGR